MSNRIANPFIVGHYVSDHYFCDREQETELLLKHITNGRNVALISPRRMGKTGLISHCFNQEALKNEYYTFFVDIYATSSLSEFVYHLGNTIFKAFKGQKSSLREKFFNVIKSLRVGFKLDAITGEPSLDISLGDIQNPQITLDEIFTYLENLDKPSIVAIDEFQQIKYYAEKNVEALLRGKIQFCKQTYFIFSGSKRNIMSNMFTSYAKPFYQSAIIMGLNPIPKERYADFVSNLFLEYGKIIENDVANIVYERYEGTTWFIQMIMNELFALSDKERPCTTEIIENAIFNVIQSQEVGYKEVLQKLTTKQRAVLLSIVKEGYANEVTSSAFIKRYNLTSASSLQAALKFLLDKDFVTNTEKGYKVYDYFFEEWLRSTLY